MKYVAIISKSLRRNNSFLRTEPSKLVNFSAWKYNEFMLLTSSVSSSFGLLSYSTMNSSIQTFHSSKIFVDSLKTTQQIPLCLTGGNADLCLRARCERAQSARAFLVAKTLLVYLSRRPYLWLLFRQAKLGKHNKRESRRLFIESSKNFQRKHLAKINPQ